MPPQSLLLEPQGPGRDSGQALMFSSGERLERLLSLNKVATSKMTAGMRQQEQPWASMPFTLGLVLLPHCCVTLSQSPSLSGFPQLWNKGVRAGGVQRSLRFQSSTGTHNVRTQSSKTPSHKCYKL